MSRGLRALADWDLALYRRAARTNTPLLDRTLPRLTRSANHGALWLAVAAGLAASGGRRRRRAAVRGLASLAVASAAANVPGKLTARRPRPQLLPVPLPRQLLRQPTTSSFPSGHAASAAAFAIGVGLEYPVLAVPVGVAAAGVAYGRVYTGVHYPGDVLAGVALGAGAAWAVSRVWPLRPEQPAVAGPARFQAPAVTDGGGLVVVLNESAGAGARADEIEAELTAALPACEVIRCTAQHDLADLMRAAAARARVLGVAGGDGTVNCAAGFAMSAGVPLAVLPGGTLDHFAAELGISSVQDVVEALAAGSAVQVTVGSAEADGDGLVFLNTFALGVYPDLVREREKREAALGKWPALVLAMFVVLRRAKPVFVEVDGRPRRLWTLFAGNGHYHPAGFAPSWRERLDDGCIDVRTIDADAPFSRTRLIVAVISGRLGRCRVYEQRIVAKLAIRTRQGALHLARDGEVAEGPGHLNLHAAGEPLVVYRLPPRDRRLA
ncbi:MAG: phosphatase PAP2 family protein [Actinomycetota bacterium]|nr:phosphatase PAP2 family protein [Actinomycetota bacterium]